MHSIKINLIVFITLLMLSITAYAGEVSVSLNELINLAKNNKYQEALEKHVIFHEETKSLPSMAGVRLSYAITAWVALGKKYPPALDALKSIRDKNKQLLLSGKGEFDNFHDMSSINKRLDNENITYDVFLILDKKYPKQAKVYYHVAENLLIRKKEYKLCGKYIGNPTHKYKRLKYIRETQIGYTKGSSKLNDPEFIKYIDESFVDGVVKLLEVLVAINKIDKAKGIQKTALSYFADDRIKHAIQ